MPDINLLSTSTTQEVATAKTSIPKILSRVLLLVLVGMLLFYGYLFYADYSAKKTLSDSKAAIDKITADAKKTSGREEVLMRQGQTQELGKLIDSHLYWSQLFPELAKVTLGTAKYTSIDAKSDGKLSLLVTLPSYDDLEKFMQIFDLEEYNKEFSDVRITNISKVQNENSLETQVGLDLKFNPDFIKQKPQ